jgi:hypothetical protein
MLSTETETDDDGAKARASPARHTAHTVPAESQNWFSFIPLDQRPMAIAYLASKGWVEKESTSLHDVQADKVELIVGNKPAFLKAIAK